MTETPTIACGSGLHLVTSRREPVFHTVGHEGSHGLVTLDIVKVWARQVLISETDFGSFYTEPYVGMPGEPRLIRCELGFAGTDKKPKMTVTIDKDQDGWVAGVLWTCDL